MGLLMQNFIKVHVEDFMQNTSIVHKRLQNNM
jgi:hypothetical protein